MGSTSRDPASTQETSAGPVDNAARWLGSSWHVLVVVLVVVGTIRALSMTSGPGPWVLAGVLLGLDAIFVVTRRPRFVAEVAGTDRTTDSIGPWVEGAGLVAAAVAVAAYPDAYVWLAFPVGLIVFHRLPVARSLVTGAALTVGCLLALARVEALTGPRILGPIIGLAVAAAGATAIRTLQAEATRRWHLVVELRETRALAARRDREAGILEERARLARDIHDTVAQGLSSVLMLSAAVQQELVAPPGRVADHLAQIEDIARQDLAATRRLIADLSPPDLDRNDLAHALGRRAERVRGSTGVAVDLDLMELPAMPRDLEVAVLRIVGQALDNAVTHGDPDRVRISAATVGDRVVVDIHDNGIGFDPHTTTGRGIDGMRTRAEMLGGSLTIESPPDGGTVVAVGLPLASRWATTSTEPAT